MPSFSLNIQFVDLFLERVYPARISVSDGKILTVEELSLNVAVSTGFLLPGFIDSHVHIESSMLVPAEFARLAVIHGTVASVSDPHEIANVCGLAGIDFMIRNGRTVPFKFCFGAPSCVPATTFETSGALLNAAAVEKLLGREDIGYLSEVMNFPGVLHRDTEVLNKIRAAQRANKPVDGHAPGLRGEQARQYIEAGISTDHECFSAAEALEKLQYGMKIIIREGSAARNFEALYSLLNDHAGNIMFGSDDKHPDSLVQGHINQLCARAVGKGISFFKVLKAACINPVLHYRLPVGLVRPGDPADFIIVNNLKDFDTQQTFINGQLVAEKGKSNIRTSGEKEMNPVNHFHCQQIKVEQLAVNRDEIPLQGNAIPVIGAADGQLITSAEWIIPTYERDQFVSDKTKDLMKIVVVNRYFNAPIAKAFIKNTGLQRGAIASSVAHDSHNIVAIGADDESLCKAINFVIAEKGGISCADENEVLVLPLPVAGLMSADNGYLVAQRYTAIDAHAKRLGCTLLAPFMTLSFMALLVIPELKLSDLGLFDGNAFRLLYPAFAVKEK